LQEAQLVTKSRANVIRDMLKGKNKSANGFFWKKGFGKAKIDLSKHKWGQELTVASCLKKVKQLSLDGILIKTYPSLKQAAEEVNISASNITNVCKGYQKTAKGYRWEYA
jgi:hypothetical protein